MKGMTLKAQRLVPVIDQAMSAVSNVMLLFGVTRVGSGDDLGTTTLVLATYAIAIGSTRAWLLDPLLLDRLKLEGGQVLSVALALGLVPSLLAAGDLCLGLGSEVNRIWLIFFVGLPGLLVQDGIRYIGFARNRPQTALLSDLVWVGAFAFVIVFALSAGLRLTTAALATAWVIGAALAALAGMMAARQPFLAVRLRELRSSLTSFHYSLLADYSLSTGIGQLTTFALPAFVGLQGIGALRTTQAVFGLTNVLFAAAYVRTLPFCAAHIATDRRLVDRRLMSVSALLATCGGLLTLGLVALPADAGQQILGTAWVHMKPLVLPVGISCVMGGVVAGAFMGLRGTAQGGRILGARVATLIIETVVTLGAAARWGAPGAAWGVGAGSAAATAVYWRIYLRSPSKPT